MNKALRNFVSTACRILPDRIYLKLRYRLTFHKKLDLEHPHTYNQKLQWLKLNDHNPLYPTLVDKYEVKRYLEPIIGSEHIIPTLGVWDSEDDIDFDALPDQFVLKCTHDSGSVVLCHDKSTFDIKAAKAKLSKALRHNFYNGGREWPYKNLKHRIIAEPLIKDPNSPSLDDYKLYCFDGKVKLLLLALDRNVPGKEVSFDYYDEDFNHLDLNWGHGSSGKIVPRPPFFDEMKELAEKLSQGMRHVRVDFYYANGKVLFGEYTFYDGCGFVAMEPLEWNDTIGDWIKL